VKRLLACASLAAVVTTATVVPAAAQTGQHPVAKRHAAHAVVKRTAARAGAKKYAVHAKVKGKAKPRMVAHRQICRVAPADEYFGKLKMSILGIRNTIKDQGLRVDVDPDKASPAMGAMVLTEDAMHDWQRKYPCDSWIPGTIYALEVFYAKVHTPDGVKKVHATYAWLRHDFPHNRLVALALNQDRTASAIWPAAAVANETRESLPAVPAAGFPAVPSSVTVEPPPAPSPGPAGPKR